MNYLAILVAAIGAFAVGALWYGPLFGKQWRRLMGMGEGTPMGGGMPMPQAMIGGFIATLVLAYVLAELFGMLGVATVGAAVTVGFWIWLGFVATIMLNSVFYERKSWNLYAINASHYLVAILLASVVLGWWR